MNAEIIGVGTELLLGQIVNSNAQYLSRELAQLGVNVYYHSVVGDNENRLIESIKQALKRVDLVITTGGLGPTQDDLTKETVAKVLDLPLELHKESIEWIQNYFKQRKMEVSPNNEKQAYLPKGCIVLPNSNGTAPGCIIEKDNKVVILFPGPPYELEPMFKNSVIPYLKEKSPYVIYSKELKIIGIGEGHLEEKIKDLLLQQSNPTIAPYAKNGEVQLRITAKETSIDKAKSLIQPIIHILKERLATKIYTEENKELEEVVVSLLREKKLTLSSAESCTGGMLASKLINVSGASEIFTQGLITYSNESKEKLLGVEKGILESFGAVSKETANEMAKKVRELSKSDIGIGVTGIAGPTGGSDNKPVGLVYVALSTKDHLITEEIYLNGNREKIRHLTTLKALDLVRNYLIKDSI